MSRKIIAIFVLFLLPKVAHCEVPITIVKPDKSIAHDIDFAINVVDENLDDPGRFKYQRIVLTIHLKDRDKWRISTPMVLVMNGKDFVCRAMLDELESGYDLRLGAVQTAAQNLSGYERSVRNPCD